MKYLKFSSANECYEFNTDYWGNDLNNCDVKTDTSQECQQLCFKTEGCLEFTWLGIAVNDDEERKHQCCMKDAVHSTGNKKSMTGLVSGPKNCGMMNHY